MRPFAKRCLVVLACAGFCLTLLTSDVFAGSFWQNLKGIFSDKAPVVKNITIEKRTGKIEVITPDGNKRIYELGDAISSIPVGSTINVLSGELVISCGGYEASLERGDGIAVTGTSTGALHFKATSGVAKITTPEGKTLAVQSGDTAYVAEPAPEAPSAPEHVEVPDTTEDPPASPSTP